MKRLLFYGLTFALILIFTLSGCSGIPSSTADSVSAINSLLDTIQASIQNKADINAFVACFTNPVTIVDDGSNYSKDHVYLQNCFNNWTLFTTFSINHRVINVTGSKNATATFETDNNYWGHAINFRFDLIKSGGSWKITKDYKLVDYLND